MTLFQKISNFIENTDRFSIEGMRIAAIVFGVFVFGFALRGVMFSDTKTSALAVAYPVGTHSEEVMTPVHTVASSADTESGKGGDIDAAVLTGGDAPVFATSSDPVVGLKNDDAIILPVKPTVSADNTFALSAEAYIVARGAMPVEVSYEKNSRVRRAPASLTKLMTATIITEQIPADEVITITENAVATEGIAGRLHAGEQFRASDLMTMMLIVSSNDAATAFTDHFTEKGDDLIARMNEKARELGMNDTHFTNPSGLDDDGHYSTAFDLALLASYSLRHEPIWEVLSKKADTVYAVHAKTPHYLLSNNPIVQQGIPEVQGSKTGFTDRAGGSLITALDDGVVVVVLGSDDRAQDTKELISMVRRDQ